MPLSLFSPLIWKRNKARIEEKKKKMGREGVGMVNQKWFSNLSSNPTVELNRLSHDTKDGCNRINSLLMGCSWTDGNVPGRCLNLFSLLHSEFLVLWIQRCIKQYRLGQFSEVGILHFWVEFWEMVYGNFLSSRKLLGNALPINSLWYFWIHIFSYNNL